MQLGHLLCKIYKQQAGQAFLCDFCRCLVSCLCIKNVYCLLVFTTGERPGNGDADCTSRMWWKSKTLEYEAFNSNPKVWERIFSVLQKIIRCNTWYIWKCITVVVCLRCMEVSYRVPFSVLLYIKLNPLVLYRSWSSWFYLYLFSHRNFSTRC